jgi:uncharacterized damage-inducible protein DinB
MGAQEKLPEPWLRGTLTDVPAVQRAILHAFEAAELDLRKWCADLTDAEVHEPPAGLASVAFHLRHIPGSIDRLLTYAEGGEISEAQLDYLRSEGSPGASASELLQTLSDAVDAAAERVRKFSSSDLEQPRGVGRKHLPTTVGGLLVHVADHTQRHVGQAITTTRVIIAARANSNLAHA